MKRLNAFILGTALATSLSVSAQSTDIVTLKKKLAPWQPAEISQKDDQITVALPDKNVSSEVYSLLISNTCTPIWTKDAPANYLNGIKQINVVNKFKASGYSFENPLNVCKEMGDLMEKPAEVKMLSNTHIYKAK
ncbi:hypothetical protein [Erwinia sp. S59]|uniref:hypothetical protein n=1 Tax=Erwinia sp. S59 TaxID=2769340 RepID=UPI00190E2A6F|nr:hypothetical protein [Erwinia sp. S59]MBK0089474.1 hypothetical protein [Erwinia sp. S59]